MNLQHNLQLTNKKVLVVGMGRTALALTRLLVSKGAEPWLSDSKPATDFAPQLEALGARIETGGHSEEFFADANIVIPSPGVSPAILPIQRAVEAGATLMCELELASRFAPSRLITVTGTNGKTTTTEWITAMIRMCGHSVILAGNNATPLSQAVLANPAPLYIVVEASSYQLDLVDRFRPWIGAILNITPDHLGRHGTLENYAAAKLRMFQNHGVGDHAILNADDPVLREHFQARPGQSVHWFSTDNTIEDGIWLDGNTIRDGKTEIAKRDDIRIPGAHNLANALASLAVMRAGLFEEKQVRRGLYAFKGVEHRIETVATIDHVTYVNDSKATNLASMAAALRSFTRPIILIAGGEAKGEDYSEFRELVREKVRALVTMGKDGPQFAQAYGESIPVHETDTMHDAIAHARQLATRGDVILLSPGCASFDAYNNFEERGRDFKTRVAALESQKTTKAGP